MNWFIFDFQLFHSHSHTEISVHFLIRYFSQFFIFSFHFVYKRIAIPRMIFHISPEGTVLNFHQNNKTIKKKEGKRQIGNTQK